MGDKVPDLSGLFLRGYGSQAHTKNNGVNIGVTETIHTSGLGNLMMAGGQLNAGRCSKAEIDFQPSETMVSLWLRITQGHDKKRGRYRMNRSQIIKRQGKRRIKLQGMAYIFYRPL